METWDAITARRDVRRYTDDSIDDADLDRILEAGRRSPSASNRQKWDFVVVTDRQQLTERAPLARRPARARIGGHDRLWRWPIHRLEPISPDRSIRPRAGDDGDDADGHRSWHRQRPLSGG